MVVVHKDGRLKRLVDNLRKPIAQKGQKCKPNWKGILNREKANLNSGNSKKN